MGMAAGIPNRAPRDSIFDVRTIFEIICVQEGFRIVQGCDWTHLDQVSAQNHHSRSILDPFFFSVGPTLKVSKTHIFGWIQFPTSPPDFLEAIL